MTKETMLKELDGLQQIVLLYSSEGRSGPKPTATIETRETFDQIRLKVEEMYSFPLSIFFTQANGEVSISLLSDFVLIIF